MGISISVESLLVTESHRRPGDPPVAHLNRGKDEVIGAILAHFGWRELPWEEPSERVGTMQGGFRHSTFNSLNGLVYRYDLDDDCPHLLQRDTYCTYYIPVDFERPWAGKGGHMETFVISSSPRLLVELEVIGMGIDEHTYENASELWEFLIAAARESVALNVPLQLLW